MPVSGPRPYRLTSPSIYDGQLDAPPDFSVYDYGTPPEDDSAFQTQVEALQSSLNAPTGRRGFSNYDAPEDGQEVAPVPVTSDAGQAPPTSEAANNPRLAQYSAPGSAADAGPYEDPTASEPPKSEVRNEPEPGKPALTSDDVGGPEKKQAPSTWDAVRKKDQEIQNLKRAYQAPENAIGSLFANNVRGYWASLHQLEQERRDLYQQAVYEDNRKGTETSGQPYEVMENGVRIKYQRLKNGQVIRLGQAAPSPLEAAAKIRADEKLAIQKAKKESRFSSGGKLWYVDPTRGVQPLGPEETIEPQGPQGPEAGGAPLPPETTIHQLPADEEKKAGGVHYETDKQGVVWRFFDDSSKPPERVGPYGKPQIEPERTPKEDPIEKAARDQYHDAVAAWLRDNPGDQAGAERQGQAAAGAARAYFEKMKKNQATPQAFDPQNPPIGTKRRNKKTNTWEIFTTTGWQSYTGKK